jgi:hypothetical protein
MSSSKSWSERGCQIVQLLTLCERRESRSKFVLQEDVHCPALNSLQKEDAYIVQPLIPLLEEDFQPLSLALRGGEVLY